MKSFNHVNRGSVNRSPVWKFVHISAPRKQRILPIRLWGRTSKQVYYSLIQNLLSERLTRLVSKFQHSRFSLKHPEFTLFVDFDATFIHETFLIQWVKYILSRSEHPVSEKMRFAVGSSIRGAISVLSSYSEYTNPFAVKFAFRTFKNFHKKEVDEFIQTNRHGKYMINPNVGFLQILKAAVDWVRKHVQTEPQIIICSQGSFRYAVKKFLCREDVRELLHKMELFIDPADDASIRANDLITSNDIFTGDLKNSIVTKYNRLEELSGYSGRYIFIGDDKDETAIQKQSKQIHFINHRRVSPMSVSSAIERSMSDLIRDLNFIRRTP